MLLADSLVIIAFIISTQLRFAYKPRYTSGFLKILLVIANCKQNNLKKSHISHRQQLLIGVCAIYIRMAKSSHLYIFGILS